MITTGHDRARAAWWSGARAGFAVAVITALALLVAACGASDGGTSDPRDDRKTAAATADPVADLVGPGCADYAKAVPDGSGSFDGMASSPVASAARNNPLLSMLVKAFSGRLNPDVDLVDLLNGGEYTVFAPVDDAFDKLPADLLTAVSDEAGGATLSGILAHHVIPRRLAPADIDGTFMTINGDELRITGSGDDIVVDGQAAVVCGGIQTGNATVYLIDSVLMPPAGQ